MGKRDCTNLDKIAISVLSVTTKHFPHDMLWSMSKELSFRCEVCRREHGGWIYWIYLGDDPRESSIESYASGREALLAGYQRMEQVRTSAIWMNIRPQLP